jgi:hypothetical protein
MPVLSNSLARAALIVAIAAAGFGLTLFIFYPGIMTYDAMYVYRAIAEGRVGDWQSPLMTALWAMVDPIAPGSASMFMLITALYWMAFGVLALTLRKRCFGAAMLLLAVALLSPAFALLGSIWRDVLFANIWLLAGALAFAAQGRTRAFASLLQGSGLALLMLGLLLRPNALFAAPILGAYMLSPHRMPWRRLALLYVPAILGLYGLVQLVYYGAFDAMRQNPLHSLIVFDLGGISHFSQRNVFPVEWTPEESRLLMQECYDPSLWDVYWTRQPCSFVMARLERDKVFGSPALVAAWRSAIFEHPLAYLRHRLAFTTTFLFGENLTMWTQQLDDPTQAVLTENAPYVAFRSWHDFLKPTPLLKTGAWLFVCAAALVLMWPRRDEAAAWFAIALCASAIIYTLTFVVFGVASDFRYALWTVMAGSVSAVLLTCRPVEKTVAPR